MSTKVLTPAQVDSFIHLGYTKVEAAFPREKALAAQDFVWAKLESKGIRRDDPSTWKPPVFFLTEIYYDAVFQECFTPRLRDAVQEIVGAGRWSGYDGDSMGWGWWPVNFSLDADKPWDVPCDDWHWDGGHFVHTVDAPNQGTLLLCLFSEIRPRDGGTLIVEGSHQIVARFLHQHPEGLQNRDAVGLVKSNHTWMHALSEIDSAHHSGNQRIDRFMNNSFVDADGTALRVVETTGNPGDIYLCHPFLFHSRSPNHSGHPRFMCNLTTPLREKMNFNRADGNYSPLEMSIRNVISG